MTNSDITSRVGTHSAEPADTARYSARALVFAHWCTVSRVELIVAEALHSTPLDQQLADLTVESSCWETQREG